MHAWLYVYPSQKFIDLLSPTLHLQSSMRSSLLGSKQNWRSPNKIKWCQMFLHWHLIIGVFVPLIKQKIISASQKAPTSQGLPTEGWTPSKTKGLRKRPGNIKKRSHFTQLLSKTWMKPDRRVWSSKTGSGQTLIIPLKKHRPTAWHGTRVHSHLASAYIILSPATANQTVRHSGVPVHHSAKTDSAQECPGLQDLGLPVPHSPGPNRPHCRPHLSPSSLLDSHPKLLQNSQGNKPWTKTRADEN